MRKKNFKIISLIPAKKNSRELKNKNFKKLNDLTLFEIAIKSSLNSKFIKQTFISSDSSKILKLSKKYNIKTINRLKNLSTFETSAEELIFDFIIKNYNDYFDEKTILVYLQPTSPFRNHHHIDSAIKSFLKNKFSMLISVKENKNFYKSFFVSKKKIKPYFGSKHVTRNRQNLEKIFTPNGAIYIFYIQDFLKKKKFDFNNTGYYLMNSTDSIDIDSSEDYNLAKLLSKKLIKYKI